MSNGSGGALKSLLVLLVLLGGAGGWNYKRNADIENAEVRPYRGYSDGDLAALIGAYEGEAARHTQTLEAVGDANVTVHDRALLGDQVREFERVQSAHNQRRAITGNIADNEASRKQIDLEIRKREADRPAYRMVMRRVLSFEP